jgi:hypothetical protein
LTASALEAVAWEIVITDAMRARPQSKSPATTNTIEEEGLRVRARGQLEAGEVRLLEQLPPWEPHRELQDARRVQ